MLGGDLDGFAVEGRETVDTELAAFPRTNGVNLELFVGVTFVFTVISSPVEASTGLVNFRPVCRSRSKSMMNYSAANAVTQPGEIDASKVLLDTLPPLFVHVVLR